MKITKLPDYLRQLRQDVDNLYKLFEKLNHQTIENIKTEKGLDERESRDHKESSHEIKRAFDELEKIRLRNAELEHMVTAQKISLARSTQDKPAKSTELFADNHDLDAFYVELENFFRGSEAETLKKHIPYIKVLDEADLNKKLPIADLGCGRGEFLELLAKNGYKPIGVDLNESMVKRAKQKGFDAVNGDAVGFLVKQPSNSLSGVTGFHLAEHIPFDNLLMLIAEAYRCLTKGGILLLETPNPESLFVGAFTFHYDPSHLKPLPPAIVQFAAKFKGFERADILRFQPELTDTQIKEATKNPTLQDALKRLYGPRDYALVAYK